MYIKDVRPFINVQVEIKHGKGKHQQPMQGTIDGTRFNKPRGRFFLSKDGNGAGVEVSFKMVRSIQAVKA